MTAAKRKPIPGDLALHPVVLGSLVLLVVNDHYLKEYASSWLTGKLSDVAGLVLTPLLAQVLLELTGTGRRLVTHDQVPVYLCAAVAAAFVAIECWSVADHAFRWGLGLAQWPFRALIAGGILAVSPVAHVADAEDLWTLPSLLAPWWVGRERAREWASRPDAAA